MVSFHLCPCALPWRCLLHILTHCSCLDHFSVGKCGETHCSLNLKINKQRHCTTRVFTSSACVYPCKTSSAFSSTLHDVFALTPVSCLSLIGLARAMESRLTCVDFLGWRPNHLAPCQTLAGPKLQQHNRWALKGPAASALLQEDEEEDGRGKRDRN